MLIVTMAIFNNRIYVFISSSLIILILQINYLQTFHPEKNVTVQEKKRSYADKKGTPSSKKLSKELVLDIISFSSLKRNDYMLAQKKYMSRHSSVRSFRW